MTDTIRALVEQLRVAGRLYRQGKRPACDEAHDLFEAADALEQLAFRCEQEENIDLNTALNQKADALVERDMAIHHLETVKRELAEARKDQKRFEWLYQAYFGIRPPRDAIDRTMEAGGEMPWIAAARAKEQT